MFYSSASSASGGLVSVRPDFCFEDEYDEPVCGIDEVGRGPLAGPVVAAAVIIRRSEAPPAVLAQIDDSKKLTPQKRAYLYKKIQEFSYISVAECSVREIDRINILQASLRAMAKACRGLELRPAVALVDGNRKPKLPCSAKTIVSGDSRSLSIAAASIIAKHYRDSLMIRMADDFPNYGWQTNVGYATPYHMKALEIYGVTIHHRRSFLPISKQLVKELNTNN